MNIFIIEESEYNKLKELDIMSGIEDNFKKVMNNILRGQKQYLDIIKIKKEYLEIRKQFLDIKDLIIEIK